MLPVLLLVTCLSAGCRGEEARPAPDSTMVDVLVELHLLNARAQVTRLPVGGGRDSVFAKYGLDSATYARTLTYYAENPEEYAEIYGRVVDRLTAEESPVIRLDSIAGTSSGMPPSR